MRVGPILLATLALTVSVPALAGPYAQAMGSCLADNTTGKERKDLARWIFSAMATHPEMRDLSNATEQTREGISQSVGQLVTRLLTDNCADETRTAIQQEGSTALKDAFASLGTLAMQELMSNKEVNAAISSFEQYVDRKKLQEALAIR